MQQLVDNRYRLERILGSGGMADVYLAHDNILDRDVALKVMSDRYANDEEFVERFKREARSAAALSHPHIVSIYDRGESEDGTYYIAMEYLPGGTLKDRIMKRGALPPRVATEVALQISEALRAAHESGVVHRDIKPHNILITDSGDVKVTDFGIARAATSSTMTRTGAVLGTAHYISPEQAMGEPVSPASDLYSLGVVLYEMLTGELPYDADTPIGIAMQHVNGLLRPPREIDPSIPEGIDAVTCRLLAKNPADRYGSARELIDDLERISAGLEPLEETTQIMNRVAADGATGENTLVGQPPARRRREKKRRRLLPLLILLPLLALLASLGWAGYGLMQNDARESPLSRVLSPDAGSPGEPVSRIEVPDLKGMMLEEAKKEYGDSFEIVEDDKVESEKPVGTILSQDPAGGERIAEGSEISVVVSETQVAEVPSVVDSPRDEAEKALKEAGFEVKVDEEESGPEQEGLVIEQDPQGGQKEEVGSEVEITVGTGPPLVAVPNIPMGATAAQAREQLEAAGLLLGAVNEAPSAAWAEGSVIDQDPAPGTEVEAGSAVNITLSSGPPPVEVPNVIGQNIATAQQMMVNSGLRYTSVAVRSNEPVGTVIATDPGAGVVLDQGTRVTISYSTGPPAGSQIKPEPTPTATPRNSAPSPEEPASNPKLPAEDDAQPPQQPESPETPQENNQGPGSADSGSQGENRNAEDDTGGGGQDNGNSNGSGKDNGNSNGNSGGEGD